MTIVRSERFDDIIGRDFVAPALHVSYLLSSPHVSGGLGPGSWSGRGVIGCDQLLSISYDTHVKI